MKIAFITGRNRGIGLETAKELGKAGYAVVLGVREPGKAEEALATLRAAGVDAEAIRYDANRPETDASVAAHLEGKYGKLDVLVNNAGVIKEELGGKSAVAGSQAELEETFAVNFFAVVRLTRVLVPLLAKSEAGRIVNLSSILGSLGVHTQKDSPIAFAKAFAYNASKTALNAFTVHLADALQETKIKVNSAHPGWVQTELGGPHAPEPLSGSARTSVRLATLGADGPTGGFFYKDDALPW